MKKKEPREIQSNETALEVVETKLNPQQEKFCEVYLSDLHFANGVKAYAEAYKIDLCKERSYNNAKAAASRLLTNPDILNRINSLLEELGLNDSFVDKHLLFLIQQHADLSIKLGAIREYNKLKQRITDKAEVKLKLGKDLEEEIYE